MIRRNRLRLVGGALVCVGLLGTLSGCDDHAKGTAPAASASAANKPAAEETKFDRTFAGLIGESAKATMHLVRDGQSISGEYAYDKVGRGIALKGSVQPDGSLLVTETVNGTVTGEFSGKLADGAFAGTWSSASGDKKFPFKFDPSAQVKVPMPAAPVAVNPQAKNVPAATDDVAAAALVKIAKAQGTTVDLASAQADFAKLKTSEYAKDGIATREAFHKKYGVPVSSGFVNLFAVDANNDGSQDYLIVETNPVGMHNDNVTGVFVGKGDAVVKSDVPNIPSLEKTATNLSVEQGTEGTILCFTEYAPTAAGGKKHRVLWKKGAAKEL